jgi:hypothetical protein
MDTEILRICPASKKAVDQRGEEHPYDSLIWCADLKSLYERLDEEGLGPAARISISRERARYEGAKAGESVFSLFLAVDAAPEAFARISKGHFIHTPRTAGLGELRRGRLERIKSGFGRIPKREVLDWLGDFCRFNSYEISIPALKDPSLAPAGKTGLAASILFDGELCRAVEGAGWFDEFRNEAAERMLDALTESPFPFLGDKLIFRESATPLTIMRRFGASEGAITGWSLEERPPVPRSLASIGAAPGTAIPGVFKAGQWSYSPAGVPIAILTGRIAASAAAGAPSSP